MKSDFETFVEMINGAGLLYFVRKAKGYQYIVFEDIECSSVIIVEFKNEDLLDITPELNFKSLEEAEKLWQSI
jgi:hypothetical protein